MQAADRLVAQTVRYSGRWLVVLIATAVTGALMQLLLPFVLGRTVDSLIATAPASQAWLIGCAVVVVMLVVCNSFGVWAAGANSAEASTWLRHRILRHVLGVGPAMTRRFAEGDLVTRLGVNTEEAGRAPQALVTGVALLIPAVGSVIALVFIDFWLALTLVAGLMVIVVVLRVFLRETTVIAGGYQQAQSEIAARLLDALGGARTIGAAGTAGQETQRVLAPLPRVRAYGLALWRANARAGVQAGVVGPLLEAAVLAVGGLRLAAGDLTVGELYAAARYAVLGAVSSSTLGYVTSVARARSAARRVVQMFAEPPMAYGAHPLPVWSQHSGVPGRRRRRAARGRSGFSQRVSDSGGRPLRRGKVVARCPGGTADGFGAGNCAAGRCATAHTLARSVAAGCWLRVRTAGPGG